MKERENDGSPRPRRITRRDFLATALGAAGLLVGCRPAEPAVVTATASSTPPTSPTPRATATSPPTPTPPPTATPTNTPTSAPTATSIPPTPRPPSKVVHTHHAGVWDGDELMPEAIGQMLDASIAELTGLDDVSAAWASLFDPAERIAIKVNAFRNSHIWTKVPLVLAVTKRLQEVGVPAEQIVIYDYLTSELETAGFPVNVDGPGVRCYGTDSNYTEGWKIVDTDIKLSDVVLDCDALINMPVLKSHMIAGISFALKNHYGTLSAPSRFHVGDRLIRGIGELNALPPIRDRTRLIIGDVLTACLRYNNRFPYWESDYVGDSILMSRDPVAHDAEGLQLFAELLAADGGSPTRATSWANPWLRCGAELGLGTHRRGDIDLVEMELA